MTNQDLISRFREKLDQQNPLYGLFMKTEDPMFVEIAGLAGFDFAVLDMEHGPVSLQGQQNNIRAAVARDLFPIIRVKDISANAIGSALDVGACGIQIPHVKNADQARQVVKYARFYPDGMRGICRFVRAADYSALDRTLFFDHSKDAIVIVQLEGLEAIANLREILYVDGIDILFIGPYDLSQALGVPGQINHSVVTEEMKKITDQARKHGKIVGTFVDTIPDMHMWRASGIQYLCYNTDAGLFYDACKMITDAR